jgi:aerobic-type carbon monoxide dehydrogenase small subunit (CoxS/CutS family)
MRYAFRLNGRPVEVDVPAATPLLCVLRDSLGLTGARFGCGHGACGACVVLADGKPVASCTTPVESVANREVLTIEGLAKGDELHPVQRAFLEDGALQCGYCTSGMILAAVALLDRVPHPSTDEIRHALAPHLCRCGVYVRVITAVQRASR